MKKDNNKKNILWFRATSMKNLYKKMENWQEENEKRFLSFSIEKENSNYACIALTNPSEVTLVDSGGREVDIISGNLCVSVEN